VHVGPVAQVPLQRPPQPSDAPHASPGAQRGVHAQRPPAHDWPAGQVPLQTPPQPSGAPQAEAAQQFGRQAAHAPFSQRVPAGQRPQPQVATQRPSLHCSPDAQVTDAQGSATQVPARHV
jgi:hypothetical protein